MYTFLLYCVTVTWWIVFCLVSCYFFGIKSLMLDLTQYIQILHNLECWSVCHSSMLCPPASETHPLQAHKGTLRVCGIPPLSPVSEELCQIKPGPRVLTSTCISSFHQIRLLHARVVSELLPALVLFRYQPLCLWVYRGNLSVNRAEVVVANSLLVYREYRASKQVSVL